MADERVERRLAAILAADVAGYSRLMGVDEVGTLAALRALRREIVDPAITAYKGRIVKTTGDGLLVEFASAVDAVTCAVSVQEKMAARAGHAAYKIAFRIGINVGDIIIEADDIFGDGVNVAARVENECEPGGVYLSGNAVEQIRGKTGFVFDDLGERSLKNIDQPVRLYAARSASSPRTAATKPPVETGKPLALPDKPSIAVLPFQNMSGDPEQEYFADGVVEEIITALSRFKTLFVIARNSSFTYKSKATDARQIGKELGVRYVLEGSVRKAANRLRITAQLIDTTNGIHLWANRFDGTIEAIFDLQDQVTMSVVGAITPSVERAEIDRATLKPTNNLAAYDYYMRGISSAYQWSNEGTSEALRHYYKAMELDPNFAMAYALAACCYSWRKMNGWTTDLGSETVETKRLAEHAVRLGQDDAQVLGWSGAAISFVLDELDLGIALVERALQLNPNLMDAWLSSGLVRLQMADWKVAIDHFARAMRLSPFDPMLFMMQQGTAAAHFFLSQYEDAASWAAKSIGEYPGNPRAWRIAAASHAWLGRQDQAQKAMVRLRQLDPSLRMETLDFPFRLPREAEAKMRDGLRKAGLPE